MVQIKLDGGSTGSRPFGAWRNLSSPTGMVKKIRTTQMNPVSRPH
jgi:hypothetical protein